MKILTYKILPILVSLLLFIVPFFWLKPGEMDLGGDSSRLYFYDPLSYFKNYSFFGVSPSGFGAENIGYFTVPFILLLFVLKLVLPPPTILISAFHGMSLSVGFLACYLIVKELIENKDFKKEIIELAGLLAGLFYVLSLSSIQGWDKVLIIHNQFFLNPLIFFLFLRYFKTTNIAYLISILLVTFIFSPNFSFAAAPPILAFYPLAIIFLLFYTAIVFKKPIIWKHLIISFVAFLFLQAFHIIPQVVSTFSPGSVIYKTVFSNEGKFDRGLSYFSAIAPSIKVSFNLMSLPQMTKLGVESLAYIIFPAIILFGYLRNKSKTLLLAGIFFLIALFFSSANITSVGLNLYKLLFNIPGFSMFRNFYGQWGYVLLFFYTILLGQSLAIVFSRLKKKYLYSLAVFITLLLVIPAWTFINGTLVNKVLWKSKDVKIAMKIDPKYEEMLSFIRSLPSGKILTLPLTDPGYQIVRGVDGGAYQGPSTIAYLTGKQDFAGFDELGKFNGLILDLARDGQFLKLRDILGFLNIKYIFYNADPRIYDKSFPAFPYGHVRQFLPEDQKSYQKFIKQLSLKQLKAIDNKYFIYELDNSSFHPLFFATNSINYFAKPITDWEIPLSIEKEKNKISVFFEGQYIPAFSKNSFTLPKLESIFLKIIKNPEPLRKFHYVFSSRPPGLFWYPLVVFKEKLELHRYGDYATDYLMDRRLFLAAKRVSDLEFWGNQIPVLGNVGNIEDLQRVFIKPSLFGKGPRIWDIRAWRRVNSWEAALSRYARYFEENIATVEIADLAEPWKLEQKFLMNEYLLRDQARLSNIINNLEKSPEEKIYLGRLRDLVFSYLTDKINFELPSTNAIDYSFNISADQLGEYEVYIDQKSWKNISSEKFILKLNSQILTSNNRSASQDWVNLGKVVFDKPTTGASLELNLIRESPKNLLTEVKPVRPESMEISSEAVQISVDTSVLNTQSGIIWQIDNWSRQNYYLLTFEYLSHGIPFKIRVSDSGKDKAGNRQPADLLTENQLESGKWRSYQAMIHASRYADMAFIQVAADNVGASKVRIQLKNISLVNLPQPTILFKKVLDSSAQNQMPPQISFAKINPTKYKITVKDANDPYFLVLNQEFSSRWKLFLEGKNKYKYSFSIPFDSNIFETAGKSPISEKNHLPVNGYANAWYIAPSDVKNAKEYTLIAEMSTQQYFYFGLAISTITLMGIMIFGLYKKIL